MKNDLIGLNIYTYLYTFYLKHHPYIVQCGMTMKNLSRLDFS